MSMLDLLLGKNFPGAKCKTLLKMTISRIKLLRNKRELQLKQMQKEVAQFLQAGNEATARIRVEHVIREQNILAAYDIVELFCELLVARLPIIEAQRECPLDLREAIASLIFVAPRCSDLPELLHIRNLFSGKYGKEFAAAAMELRPDCGVNRQVIEKLAVRAPDAEIKLKNLKDIAEECNVEWDSSATQLEFFKSHEDLLDGIGKNHIFNGVKLPLEETKSHPAPGKLIDRAGASEMTSGVLDLPNVPNKVVPQRTEPRVSTRTESQSAAVTSQSIRQISSNVNYPRGEPDISHDTFSPSHRPVVNKSSPTEVTAFVSSSPPVVSDNISSQTHKPSFSSLDTEVTADLRDVPTTAQAALAAADRAAAAARAAADLAKVRIFDLSTNTFHGIKEGVDEITFFRREG